MEDARDTGTFKYSYSAQDGAEARKILEKYQPQDGRSETSDIERLRELDKAASRRAVVLSLSLGVGGLAALALGVLSALLFGWPLLLAALLAVLGIGCCLSAWPLYNRMIEADRAGVRFEVVELAERVAKGA